MSEASNRRFDTGQDMNQATGDGTDINGRPLSGAADAEITPAQGVDEENVLTKVADLLDDVTEPDRNSQPPSGGTPSTNTAEPTSNSPSLNSTWHRSSVNRQEPPDDGPAKVVADQGAVSGIPSVSGTAAGPTIEESTSINVEEQHVAPGAGQTPESNIDTNISIKGRGDGVAIELGHGDWNRLMARLDARLEQAATFFRGGQVSLDVGARPLVEAELDLVCGVLQKYGLVIGIVRTGSDRTFQSALNLGLAATMETASGDPTTEATFAGSNLGGQTHFVYRGNLRSGQVLRRQENVLIIGDVNPGGHVISSGDVLVWGRLRGVVHAGAEGDLNVIVGALLLEPTQLRIASIIAIDTERKDEQKNERRQRDDSKPAQVAYVAEGKLLVRPWQEARRGFRSVLLGS